MHRGRKILSIAFGFDKEEDIYQFAAAAPYSYSRLQKYLAHWEKRAIAFATREKIAETTVFFIGYLDSNQNIDFYIHSWN